MEFALLSAIFSKTFRDRSVELFTGRRRVQARAEHFTQGKEPEEDDHEEAPEAEAKAAKPEAKAVKAIQADPAKAEPAKAELAKEKSGEDVVKDLMKKLAKPAEEPTVTTKPIEAFEGTETKAMSKPLKVFLIAFWVISSVVGIYSAYLSWTTNTIFDMSTSSKVLCSIGAFFGGFLYLLFFYIFRWSDVEYVKKLKATLGASALGTEAQDSAADAATEGDGDDADDADDGDDGNEGTDGDNNADAEDLVASNRADGPVSKRSTYRSDGDSNDDGYDGDDGDDGEDGNDGNDSNDSSDRRRGYYDDYDDNHAKRFSPRKEAASPVVPAYPPASEASPPSKPSHFSLSSIFKKDKELPQSAPAPQAPPAPQSQHAARDQAGGRRRSRKARK